MTNKIAFIILIFWILLCTSCLRRNENSVPKMADRIRDGAGMFTEQQKDSLFVLIRNLDVSIGPQIGIVTTDTLNGEDIEDFSLKMSREMPVGRSNFRDGIFICLSKKDKKIRIDTGKGLINILTEDTLKLINRRDIIPMFKAGRYYDGVYSGIMHIKNLIEENKDRIGEFKKK